jgi:hypothetical protein
MSSPQVPDYITHYHLAQKQPFLNLSDLSAEELSIVMRDLEDRRAEEGLKRVFGRRYMELRRLTEERLYDLFIRAGGKPERTVPHYFVLGSCEWFRGLSPHMQEVVVPLRDLVQETTSFTYPDSFTAMEFGPQFDLPQVPRPYHGKVFLLQELDEVVARYGVPTDEDSRYVGYQNRPFEKYIEFQVWSDQHLSESV